MKKVIALLLLPLALFFSAPAAQAGTDNGTTNWYSSGYCSTRGGNLDVRNYDWRSPSGYIWQEYHIDADRAGGTGPVPKVYMRVTGTSTWRLLSYWNDFKVQVSNYRTIYDFKVSFANGTACAIGGL
jgi:hypothetical protein